MPTYIAKDDSQLYYRHLGNKGSVIIMLHGFGMHSGHWLPYAYLLSRKYQVIIPDLRGFGRSHHVNFNQDCAVSNFAEDLSALVTHLGIDTYKLLGISMGALTSLKFIEQYKDLAPTRYLHIDQSPCCTNKKDWDWGLFGDQHDERFDKARSLLKRLAPHEQTGAAFNDIPQELQQEVQTELAEFFACAMSKESHKRLSRKILSKKWALTKLLPIDNWSAYMHCLRAYINQGYDLRAGIVESAVPIDIIVGMKSDMYPATGQLRMADLVKTGRVIPFSKSGHTPLIDQPIKLSRELLQFAAR